jgi:hypothetical protein
VGFHRTSILNNNTAPKQMKSHTTEGMGFHRTRVAKVMGITTRLTCSMSGARFRQKFTLDDAFEVHAFAQLEASRRVTDGNPLGCPLCLPVHTVTCVQTLKAVVPANTFLPDMSPDQLLPIAAAGYDVLPVY